MKVGGLALCKNVARLEIYLETRRSYKTGGLVGRTGKGRSKITKVAVENAPGSGPWTVLC
jgi:hypothetical protein